MTEFEQIQSIRSQTLAQLDSIRANPKADVLDRWPARALARVCRFAAEDRGLVRSEAGRLRAVRSSFAGN